MLSFYPSRRLGMESRASVSGVAAGVWHHRRCISCGLIPYATSSQFHSATSCGFHPRLRRDLDEKGERYGKEFIAWKFRKLACEIAVLCNGHKIDSNTVYQIKKSSSSVFANISEAQYPQSLADMLSKFEIARKECMETESWLKLIFSSWSIDEKTFKKYRNLCGRIRRMLTSSCITIENKIKQGWNTLLF